MVFVEIAFLLLGLVLLVGGSDIFVKNSSALAKYFGVSDFIIGLTFVSLGTSLPELASAITASLKGVDNLIIGNLVGSNIANIGLIGGITAVIAGLKTKKKTFFRDSYFMISTIFLFLLFILNNTISRTESIILLFFYTTYTLYLFDKSSEHSKDYIGGFIEYLIRLKYIETIKSNFKRKKSKSKTKSFFLLKKFIICVVGLGAIIAGANYVVDNAVEIARFFSISEDLIGLSIIAIGTSLPELMVSTIAALRRISGMAIGNIIGSNIANLSIVLGIAGLIKPLSISSFEINFLTPLLFIFSIAFFVFVRTDWKLKRYEGIILLVGYVLFLLFSFLQ